MTAVGANCWRLFSYGVFVADGRLIFPHSPAVTSECKFILCRPRAVKGTKHAQPPFFLSSRQMAGFENDVGANNDFVAGFDA